MSPKKMTKPAHDDRAAARPKTTTTPKNGTSYFGRDGLLAYIVEPESFPKSRVIYYNDDWVLIHDLYPKASLHMLLLPRDPAVYDVHPLHAFAEIPGFLEKTRKELEVVMPIATSELRRLHGSHSAKERERQAAMDSDEPPMPDDLPPGRNWAQELKIGIHANPSMNHLHIHILSRDMRSECLKHRQHYQSFNTEFLVTIEEMPLSSEEIEARRNGGGEMLSGRGMQCWRCGREFGVQMKKMKAHLEEEFEAWRKE